MRRGIVGATSMITLGVLFLLGEFTPYRFHRTWPILLIAIGVVSVLSSSADTSGHLERNGGSLPSGPPPPPTAAPGAEPKQVDHV